MCRQVGKTQVALLRKMDEANRNATWRIIGKGVAQNFKQAADWYGKAAAQGIDGAATCRDLCLAQLAAATGLRRP